MISNIESRSMLTNAEQRVDQKEYERSNDIQRGAKTWPRETALPKRSVPDPCHRARDRVRPFWRIHFDLSMRQSLLNQLREPSGSSVIGASLDRRSPPIASFIGA
ncbi:unnamed protein product, partial [Iphiclides podalirius]